MNKKNDALLSNSNDAILTSRSSINPYRRAASLILGRLHWDLRVESWRSRKIIRSCKDLYTHADRAVIVCNGPSLLKSDLKLLENTYTFGLNKINLLFENNDFRPSCVVAVNPFVIEQNKDFYNQTEIPLYIDSVGYSKGVIRPRKNIAFLHSSGTGFARDCSLSIDQGHTVTYVALQLAFHMGFRKVALIGADHSFAVKGPANQTVEAGDKDESHFDPRYFSGGVKWQLPDLFQSEVAYTRAKQTFEAFGGEVLNATEGGELNIFRRVSLADFVSKT